MLGFLYRSGILSTPISFLDLKDAILVLQGLLFCMSMYISIIFGSTLYMYVMCFTPLTDSIDDRTVSMSF